MSVKNHGSSEGKPRSRPCGRRLETRILCSRGYLSLKPEGTSRHQRFLQQHTGVIEQIPKSKVPDKRNILLHVATDTHTVYLVATLSVASTTMS